MAKHTIEFFNRARGLRFVHPGDGLKDALARVSAVERAGPGPLTGGDKLPFGVDSDRARAIAALNREAP